MSVDGKISTGDTDEMDFDRDLKKVHGVREGLHQYYELEQKTSLFSLNTGKVMEKIGVNERTDVPKKSPVSFVIIDNKPHLSARGVRYLSAWVRHLYVATTNRKHPAMRAKEKNITVIPFAKPMNLKKLFTRLKNDYGIRSLTVQSGGTLNAGLIRAGLIDRLSIVIAPVLVGGDTTPTLMDGEALHAVKEIVRLCPLKLIGISRLKNSYINLKYDFA